MSTTHRHRRYTYLLVAFFVLVVAVHLHHRITDRHAWPPLDTGPAVALPSPSQGPEGASEGAWAVFSRLDIPFEEAVDTRAAALKELPSFARHGLTPTNAYPAIEAWVARLSPSLPLWEEAAAAPHGAVDFAADPNAAYAVLGRVVEMSRLTPYLAARARQTNDWTRCVALWTAALRNAAHVTHGMGTAGHVVAFDVTTTTVRDILRAGPLPTEASAALLPVLESAEAAAAPLVEAILLDGRVAHNALCAFFAAPGDPLPPGTERPAGFLVWLARRLGSSPAVSAAHLDAIVTRVAAAAGRPYSAAGLYADLPAWCRGRRPPWTNDPAAALAVCAFRDNTLAAGVYPVLRLSDLRAARYALALDATPPGASPPAAPADPFAPDGAPFVLDAPPPAWRFHGAGPDQRDDGGTNDWASASRASAGLDLLYAAPRAPTPFRTPTP